MIQPEVLARTLVKQLADVDHHTAYAALDIAKLLYSHEQCSAIAFAADCSGSEAVASGS